jgi:penicillin-binding protein 1A
VVGVWVGFDTPRTLGDGETGGRIAAPIFRDFMAEALKRETDTPFRMPAGVRLVRIDARTGQVPNAGTVDTIIEAFRPGTEPTEDFANSPIIIGRGETGFPGVEGGPSVSPTAAPGQPRQDDGLGGLY